MNSATFRAHEDSSRETRVPSSVPEAALGESQWIVMKLTAAEREEQELKRPKMLQAAEALIQLRGYVVIHTPGYRFYYYLGEIDRSIWADVDLGHPFRIIAEVHRRDYETQDDLIEITFGWRRLDRGKRYRGRFWMAVTD